MAEPLIKGQKVVIDKINGSLSRITLEVTYKNTSAILTDIDPFAFLIEESNEVKKDNIVFYHHPASQCRSVEYTESYRESDCKKVFTVDLGQLPSNVKKIAFGCAIYKENVTPVNPIIIDMVLKARNTAAAEIFSIEEPVDILNSEAVLFGDIYRYKDTFKFNTLKDIEKESVLECIKVRYNVRIG